MSSSSSSCCGCCRSRSSSSSVLYMYLCLCVLVLVSCSSVTLVYGSGDGNPFQISGIRYYVNSDYLAEVRSSIDMEATKGNKAWGEQAEKFGHLPSAYWLDTMAKVGKLMVMMEEAVNFAQVVKAPVLTSFVIYDVPTRDCYALSSNGEIQLTGSYDGPSASKENGIEFYKSSYIDPIYSIIKRYDAQSPQIVTVLFIEPDSLPNIVTNANQRNCTTAVCDAYIVAQTYTIKALGQLKSAWLYMDLAHGGWLGYKDNLAKADGPFKTVLSGQDKLIRGFVTNSANYSPLLFTTGWNDLTSKDTDYCLDELTYYGALSSLSLFAGKNVIIDTGRNGRPGVRSDMGNWCNIYNTGIGLLPGLVNGRVDLSTQACPAKTVNGVDVAAFCKKNAEIGLKAVDAVWWVKTPGESDGISEDKPGARLDKMCLSTDSWNLKTKGSDAPEAGQWFHGFFVDLVKNAIETPKTVDLCTPNPCANLGVCATATGKCMCSGGWSGTYCTVPPAGCTPNPCKNYGTCSSGGKCQCAVGFSGDTCEITTGGCDSAPGNQCFNGGVCSATPWKCTCKTGFSGTMCQDAPKCNPNPCLNGGVCFGSPLGQACFCKRGWMGVDCSVSSGPVVVPPGGTCDPVCGAHSTCTDGACACDTGYKATTTGCVEDKPVATCDDAGCAQGCSLVAGIPKCSCSTGTLQSDGKSCSPDTTPNPCNATPKPCSSTTQTCVVSTSNPNKAVCTCKQGYKPDTTTTTNNCIPVTPQQCELPCEGTCLSATLGCGCGAGKDLASDGYSCVDQQTDDDPCKTKGCSETCTALADNSGGAVCTCKTVGFTLQADEKTCAKPPSTNKCAPLVCSSKCALVTNNVYKCTCPSPTLVLGDDKFSCVTAEQGGKVIVTPTSSDNNTLVIVLIVIIAVMVVAAVGYFIYRRMQVMPATSYQKNIHEIGNSTMAGGDGAPYGRSQMPPPPPAPPAAAGGGGYGYGGNTGGYGYAGAQPPRPPPPPRM